MKTVVTYLLPFVGKHWLRIGIVGIFLFLLNQKQIDLSIQLGRPSVIPTRNAPAQPAMEAVENDERQVFTEVKQAPKKSWMSQLNVFSAPEQAPELRQRLEQLPTGDVQAYIKRFVSVAKTEQEKYGVPVSIILANGLLQSQAGQREMTTKGNNYFALDCSSDWVGATLKDEGNCYRSYQNAWTSFRDYSLFVTTGHYANLPQLGSSNYRDWAIALEDMGYAGTPDLAKQLLHVIDTWQLFQYD